MPRDAKDVYVNFCNAYARRDVDACAELVTDDVVFGIYIDRELAPFGGVTIGKRIMQRRWQMVADAFDVLHYEVTGATVEEDKLRGLVAYHFRHKATGEDISGTMRHMVHLRGEQMARIDETHDRARVEAFFRLIQSMTPPEPPPATERPAQAAKPKTGCGSQV